MSNEENQAQLTQMLEVLQEEENDDNSSKITNENDDNNDNHETKDDSKDSSQSPSNASQPKYSKVSSVPSSPKKSRKEKTMSITSLTQMSTQVSNKIEDGAISRYHHAAVIRENGKVYFLQQPYKTDGMRHIVLVEMKITRVSDINTSDETFRCQFHMFFTWLASKSEVESFNEIKTLNQRLTSVSTESKYYEVDTLTNNYEKLRAKYGNKKLSWKPDWTPKIAFMNGNGGPTSNTWEIIVPYKILTTDKRNPLMTKNWGIHKEYLGFSPQDGYWIHGMWQGDMSLTEEMELESFPFDCQDFTVNIRSVISAEQCDLLPFPRPINKDENGFSTVPLQFFSKDSVVDEWEFANMLCEFRLSNPKHSRSGQVYPKIMIQIKAKRTWQSYIGLLMVTFALYFMGLGTFSIPISDAGERLGFAITLLLAEVVNIQWALSTLPNVPYLTIIEKYIYSSFIFLFIVTVYSCLAVGILEDEIDGLFGKSGDLIDEWIGWFLFLCCCGLQIWFFIHCKTAMKEEQWHLMTQKIEYRRTKLGIAHTTVNLPCAFDEDVLIKSAKSGQSRFNGFVVASKNRNQLEERFGKYDDHTN